MKYTLLFILSLLFCSMLFGQEEVASLRFKSVHKLSDKSSYTFKNKENGELLLVIKEYNNALAVIFDPNFKGKSIMDVKLGKKRYSQIIGHNIHNNKYTLVFKSNNGKKYITQTFDFNGLTTNIKEFKFEDTDDKFVTSFQYKNRLHLLYANENNTLILKRLNDTFQFEKIKKFKVNISEEDKPLLKSSLFQAELFSSRKPNISKIDNQAPTIIENTIAQNKLYQEGSSLYITIENDDEGSTSLHAIDLDALTLTTKIHPYPKGKKEDFKKFNSFLLDNHIIQIAGNKKEMSLIVKDLKGVFIKEYYIDSNQAIGINNSPVIQNGTTLNAGRRKEIEKTKQFLKKVMDTELSVTAYPQGDDYKLMIGGSKKIASGGMPAGGFGAGMAGGAISVGVMYPTFDLSKSVYFFTTLDKSFSHKKGTEVVNAFQKLDIFKEALINETGETFFSQNDILYYGYYDNIKKKYKIYKM